MTQLLTDRTLVASGDMDEPRFTQDGDDALEHFLSKFCTQVQEGISALLPQGRLEAILLGGGYGRGEGGVLHTAYGDQPYNDLEFYIFLRGSTQFNERRYGMRLNQLAHELSAQAGIEVEFKLLSLQQLRRSPITMFSYDLMLGHRWVLGEEKLLTGCEHHRRAEAIPLAEATRLLMNRCTGLLFSLELLSKSGFSGEDADFVARNLAKVRLALGDAFLTVNGSYHWSCCERAQRLEELSPTLLRPWLREVRAQHRLGVQFKLHPQLSHASRDELWDDFQSLSKLAGRVWLWTEERRMQRIYESFTYYSMDDADKVPGTPRWRNLLVNLSHFGPVSFAAAGSAVPSVRYPRERLLRALPLLLWEPAALKSSTLRTHLQKVLRTNATDFSSMVAAYRRLWERFR